MVVVFKPAMQPFEFGPGGDAQLRIEIAEWLIEKERRRLAHDRPPHRHVLALPAGQFSRLAMEQMLDFENAGGFVHCAAICRLISPALSGLKICAASAGQHSQRRPNDIFFCTVMWG